ncbi:MULTISPECIES: ATP-binding protein [unclassified Streptomyces]|uniref:ATP-binding protein n=1 Tax=unclassified Streptomyces TaxID=2593676 RepID=UPI00296723FD|nr:ATP-binding protein [Streptomyces sp. SJL17-1]
MTYPSPLTAPRKATEPTPRRLPVEEVPPCTGRLLAAVTVPALPASVPLLRTVTRRVVGGCRLPEGVDEAVTLIVTELATNAVLHSGGAEVSVFLEVGNAAVIVRVRDDGQWQERHTPRREAADVDTTFGRGLDLVDAYALESSIARTATGTTVRAVVAF